MIDKEQAKKELNTKAQMIIIAIVVFCVSVILFSVITWFLKKLDTKENENDPKNAPAAARAYMNDTKIDKDGKIILGKSISEWWQELVESGNKMTKYLSSPEELAKIMNATMALEFPDTRENPDAPIDWNKIDIDSKEIQGIVKFKRALKDGGKPISMTYISPSKFQELINKYKKTGKESDREEALKHFTIEKTYTPISSTGNNSNIAKVESLRGMVFMGDSILTSLQGHGKLEENEGVITMHQSGCRPEFFLGEQNCGGMANNCNEGGYFNWDKQFSKVTNPTGFYLLLGQNSCHDKENRIKNMDRLIQKIKSSYPSVPIYMSSVLYHLDNDGSDKEAATSMNEELKVYCNGQSNVYYSDILRGFNDNLAEMSDDGDHPNGKGTQVLIKNIKENIVGTPSTTLNSNTNTNTGAVTGEMIVQEAEKYVGKLPYVSGGQSLNTGADCSGFVWAILKKLGLINWGRTDDVHIRTKGKEVTDLAYARAGDVICYNGHVAIYDGKGGIIHESQPGTTCKHSKNASYRQILTIRRFTQESADIIYAPHDDFSPETRQIIMNHINDFNENNFDEFMRNFPGGYDGYMQSLGGVFAKYGGKGKSIEVQNAGDFQEAAEFVWGLFSIWGFDYWNASTYWPWGKDEEFDGLYDSAYYTSHRYTGTGWGSGQGNINDVCSTSSRVKRTNCNAGIDTFLWTTNLNSTSGNGYGTRDKSGERIDNVEDLQVGDLIHFYHDSNETDWGHVAIVGEVDHSTGEVFLYDSGNRFIRTGRYKIPFITEPGGVPKGKYDTYEKWVGRRQFNLDQSTNRSANGNGLKTSSTYKVKVATWSEHLDKVESNDHEVNTYDTGIEYNMTTTTIPYQEIVSKYKMPFNYLWTMLVYSQDKNYTFDLADLVKNSKIEITIHDNLNETTNVVTDTYTDYTKIHAEADVDISFEQVSYETHKNIDEKGKVKEITREEVITDGKTTEHGIGDGERWDPYYAIHTTITKTDTLDIALTLADAWCAKYEKKYTYNGKKTTENSSSTELKPIPKKPYTKEGELGGQEDIVDQDAVAQATRYDRRNVHATGERENEFATYTTTRITRVKNIYTKNISSGYISTPGKNSDNTLVTAASTPKTGQLNKDNYVEYVPDKQGDGDNHQQGFCFVGDDLIAYATVNAKNGSEVCSLYLADAHTMKLCDSIEGKFSGHGNSIAYDSKTGDVIFPEIGVMKLIRVNKTTKTFDENNIRKQSLPEYERDTSSIAYNESKDLFISKDNVYTRTAFYSNGKPLKKIKHNMPAKNLDYSGATSFGNQVYYFYCDPSDGYAHGNYVVICNLETGNQEETLYDSTPREGEEISFTSDGTLYICYGYGKPNGKRGSVGTSFNKTDYNYRYDNNIDKSNVSLSGANTNDISQYITGGEYSENTHFKSVFNKHYNARSNILSIKEWLFKALEQNSDTVNMIDITKYLISRATGAKENRETFLAAIEKLQEGFTDMAETGGKSGIDGIQGQIYDYLLAKGVPPVGAAAIMGNIQGESSFKPDVVNSIGCSGLCQWYKGRLDNLKKLAASKGKNWTDVECQLDYLWEELNNKYTKVRDVIMAADQESELEYATWYWGRYFEVFFLGDSFEATKGNTATRYKYAQHWYQEWQQHHTSGTGGIGVINPGGITTQTEAEQLTQQYNQMLNTQIHDGDSKYQSGPFPTWWSRPYNQLSPFQCTWWANGRASMYLEQYGTKYKKYPTQMGNGGEYYSKNISGGWFNYGSTPKPNSLVSMPSGSSYGHVAYVEGVTSDGIWISDAGSGRSWRGVHFRKFSDLNVYGYIYLNEPK